MILSYQIIRDVMGFISFFMGIFLFIRFYAISKVIDKRALTMVKQLKTMFGQELVNKRIQGKDMLKIQRANRGIIGKRIKEKSFGLLDEVPDENVIASVLDRDLMTGLFWLASKTGGALGGLKELLSGEKGERKKRGGFQFE